MLRHLITSFYRQLKSNKTLHLLNFLVLSLGFVIILFIFFFLRTEFRYEHFQKNKDSIFRIVTTVKGSSGKKGKSPFTSGPIGNALKDEFPQIKDFTRYSLDKTELLTTTQLSAVFEIGNCDKSFFDIFSFKLIKGSLEAFNYKSEVIVITESTSKKLFGNEEPLGKILKSSYGYNYEVIAVLEDLPRQSHIQFEALTPFNGWAQFDSWPIYQNYQTYVLLNKNVYFSKANLKKIRHFLKDHIKNYPLLDFQPITEIHLNSDFDDPWVSNKGDRQLIFLLFSAAAILIFVMLFNYFNLTTSIYTSRTKEFSIKRVLGLYSERILYEQLFESFFFILISLCISLVVFYLIMNFSGTGISLDMNIKWLVFISIGFIGIMLSPSVITHLLSKIHISGFSLSNSVKSGVNSKYRIWGMALQILISVVIISFAVVISNQLIYIKNKELGYDYKNIIYTPIYFWRYKTETIREIILEDPNVISVSATSEPPINLKFKTKLIDWDGKTSDGNMAVYLTYADIGYLETFNIKLIAGDSFSKDFTLENYFHGDADTYYLVNAEAVKQMGLEEPIGTKFNYNGFNGEIIGVVQDFHFKPLQKKIEPLFIQFNPENWMYLFIKLKENDKKTLEFIKTTIKKFETKGYPVEFKNLEDDFNTLYAPVKRIAYSTIVFAIAAFLLSVIGLIAVISFLEKKKQKEFALKKVFGAQTNRIIKDFIIQLSWYIVPSILISSFISYYGTKLWLQNFAYQAAYPFFQLIVAIVLIYFIIVGLVYFKVRKTTNLNPSETLNYE